MTRGHYRVTGPAGDCPHRHYELSALLARCWLEMRGTVWYVDDRGQRRHIRPDEQAELKTLRPIRRGRMPTGRGQTAPQVRIGRAAYETAGTLAREQERAIGAVVEDAIEEYARRRG